MSTVAVMHAGLGMVVLVAGGLAMGVRKRRGWHTWLGELYHWGWLALTITALVAGASRPGLSLFEVITPPAYGAALLGYVAAKRRRWFGARWRYWHVQGTVVSYIAVVVALGTQVWPRLLPGIFDSPLFFWGWMIVPGILMGQLAERIFLGKRPDKSRASRPRSVSAPSGD